MEFFKVKEELKYYQMKSKIIKKVSSLVEDLGYVMFEPDYLEDYDAFIEMNQRIKKESMIKMIEPDGSISLLRPDITTSLIKHLVPKWEDETELKLYYSSTIFSRSPLGKIEEQKQFGVEYLGNPSLSADVEVLELVMNLCKEFKLNYKVVINNNRFLNQIINQLKLNLVDEKELKGIISNKNRYELNRFIKRLEISNPILQILFDLEGSLSEIKEKLKGTKLSKELTDALTTLNQIEVVLEKDAYSTKYTFDLSLLTQYDYYDGIIFKGFLKGVPHVILNGGRYDPLTKQFGKPIPAIGFSLQIQDFIKEVIKSYEGLSNNRDS
jgi:ATP phosphoribosyltransferase regulatory subunit